MENGRLEKIGKIMREDFVFSLIKVNVKWAFFRGECEMGERFCKDLCGDGICQEVVCMAIGTFVDFI